MQNEPDFRKYGTKTGLNIIRLTAEMGLTTPIPSKAKMAVPKKKGNLPTGAVRGMWRASPKSYGQKDKENLK